MSAYSRPDILTLPSLPSEAVRLCIEKTQDLVILISPENLIAGVLQTSIFETADIHHWIGQPLASIVSPESQVKIPLLLENDAAHTDKNAIWRHINLIGFKGDNIPVQALYMKLTSEENQFRLLFCRDLRPMQDMSSRFSALHEDLMQENLLLRNTLEKQTRQAAKASGLEMDHLVNSIKQSSYKKVISDTVHNLERDCIRALLQEVGGDHVRAADLAGCDMKDWLVKVAMLKM